MDERLTHLEQLRRAGGPVAMATLVATRGTTPKKEGAKMWVGAGGRILGSVTIGGCVDARVVAAADAVLASSKAELLSMDLGDEDAWEMGLTCGGAVDVLVERVDLAAPGPARDAWERIGAEAAAGRAAALVTPLDGSAARLVVTAAAAFGTLGSVARDAEAAARARELLVRGASRSATLGAAGDAQQVFIEVHGAPPALVIFGATHVAVPLVPMAKALGLRVVVVDARDRFATRERFPDADELVVGMAGEFAARYPWSASSSVVIVAHDYKVERPVLTAVLRAPAAYIGVLGSGRRAKALRELLHEDGLTDAELARIHIPIGMDLGAESAPEIALAILAQVTAVRHGRAAQGKSGGDAAPPPAPAAP